MNLVDMPQVKVFLVTNVNFLTSVSFSSQKNAHFPGEYCQCYRCPSILQKIHADKCQGSEFFSFY